MTVEEFFERLKQYCKAQESCPKCCMRLFCYTPPMEKTAYMVNEVKTYLEQNSTGDYVPSDHRISDRLQTCPLELDMSSALGYESH